jgi:4-hydroxy-3-methylbut-2-enyl diphosphate reductase
MHVIVADVLGMCFGVRDALEIIEQVAEPRGVTIHGELVHNEKVLERLSRRGFLQADEQARKSLPLTDAVLITAHGISNRERARLAAAGKTLVDSTCPLVRRAHDAAQKLEREGCLVLVIGKRGHVEVQGIVEDLGAFEVIETVDEVRHYGVRRIGLMCQTTTPALHADAVRAAVRVKNPDAELRFIDTICHPTKDHQKALEDLLDRVQAVVVVGGRNSNNTRQLVLRCRQRGRQAYHVQGAGDLRPEWFEDVENVGLTAGTSTLDETIEEVRHEMLRLAATVPSHATSV